MDPLRSPTPKSRLCSETTSRWTEKMLALRWESWMNMERGSSATAILIMALTAMWMDGDTLFAIGSITKVFTALLLQDMIERGEMKLDDPVKKYLPDSVKMPAYQGKEITLLHLATHTSGLPGGPNNLSPKSWRDPDQADYTVEQLYSFLSHDKLPRAPGIQEEYSNLG